MVVLGLATPLLAVGAYLITSGSQQRHQTIAVHSAHSPTPTPAPQTTTTTPFTVLHPADPSASSDDASSTEADTSGDDALGETSASSAPGAWGVPLSRTSTTAAGRSRAKPSDSTAAAPTTSSGGAAGTGGSGGGTAAGGGSGSTGGSTPTTAPGSGGGGGGTAPTTTVPSNIVFSDPMNYAGAWGLGGGFGQWSVTQADGAVSGTGSRVELAAPGNGRSVVTARNFGNLDLSVRLESVAQGGGSATGWVLWHYTDDTHYLAAYIGTAGWGIVLVDPAQTGGVRVLAQGSGRTLAVGASVTLRVRQVGTAISVWADGSLLASPNDEEAPVAGAIGLASVGATTRFDDVVVRST